MLYVVLASVALAADPTTLAQCESGDAGACIVLSMGAAKSDDPGERARSATWYDKGTGILDGKCRERDLRACKDLAEVVLLHGEPERSTKAWERACDIDPVGCVDIADRLDGRKNTPDGLAQKLLQRSCGHSVGLGCIGAAILGADAGAPPEETQALVDKGLGLLGAECVHTQDKAKASRACFSLGDLHYFGILMKADRQAGLEYWSRGCLSGEACRTQATLILAQGDQQGSVALLRKACELGDCTHWYQVCSEIESEWCKPLE